MVGDRGGRSRSAPQTAYGWVAFGCTVAVIIADRVLQRGDMAYLHGIGVALLVIAPVLFVPPFLLLHRHGGATPGTPYYATTRLVRRGPYAVVRHPQYLGYALLAAGFALLSQRVVTGCFAGVAIACFYLHSRREDSYCSEHLGEEYRRYEREVPAFNAVAGLWRLFRRARS